MIRWNSITFNDANSASIEQIIFFHDHSIIVLISISSLLCYIIFSILINKQTNKILLEGQRIEIIWTILPTRILLFIALPRLHLLYTIEEIFNPSISIKIIGHQWYWSYEYRDFNINFDSFILPPYRTFKRIFRLLDVDNRIVIPFNINIRLLVSSADVIHAWRIPSLGLKMDAIPGRLNQLITVGSRPGIYFDQCSEICGANHRFMPIALEICSFNNFTKWMKTK